MPVKKKLCFVCLGNIVRSPLAEHLFLHLARQRGVEHKYEVSSAGISAWHVGDSPDARMRRVAARYGLKYDGRARQFRDTDLDEFDLVLAMDSDNLSDLRALAGTEKQRRKLHLLREFDPLGGDHAIVPDPYYGGLDGFDETYRIVERSICGLLDSLESEPDSI